MHTEVKNLLKQSITVKEKLLEEFTEKISELADTVTTSLWKGGKVILFGNGGSAADAQHIAAEFVGRLGFEREGLPAIAFTTDTSVLTALGNDYGYANIFKRQVGALAESKDTVIGISTSGNSQNVLEGVKKANQIGASTIGLTGKTGGKLKDIADESIIVPSDNTQRIQESHITIGHIICQLAEEELFKG